MEDEAEKVQHHRQQAGQYFNQALLIYRLTPTKEVAMRLAALLVNFSSLNLLEEKYHEAALQLQEALPIAKQTVGKLHYRTAGILRALGDVYLYIKPELVDTCYEQALVIFMLWWLLKGAHRQPSRCPRRQGSGRGRGLRAVARGARGGTWQARCGCGRHSRQHRLDRRGRRRPYPRCRSGGWGRGRRLGLRHPPLLPRAAR